MREGDVNALLAQTHAEGLGKRGRHVAVDSVALPSDGTVEKAHQDEVCRSKAKGGTTHFRPIPLPTLWSAADATLWPGAWVSK